MKKRGLALILAALVAFSSIAPSTGNMQVFALGVTDMVESTEEEDTTDEFVADTAEEFTESDVESEFQATEVSEPEATEKVESDIDEPEMQEEDFINKVDEYNTEQNQETADTTDTESVESTDVMETAELQLPTGLPEIEVMNAGVIDTDQIFEIPVMQLDTDSDMYSSAIYNTEWDKYSTNYYYNQLNDYERQIWDAMDELCRMYLLDGLDATENQYGDYMTKFVVSGEMEWEDLYALARIFRFSNPQYYFLSTTIWYASDAYGYTYLAFGMYPAFASGTARAVETAKVKSTAEAWLTTIPSNVSEGEKVQAIHDLIVNNVEYSTVWGTDAFDEDTLYTQSAYSVFCMDETVCAGYAQTFEMLCNALGIDCITVTSSDHQWNKVRVDDSWYNVDATWADQSSGIYYAYFGRNDNYYDTDYASNAASHTEEAIWEYYVSLPICSLDTGSSDYTIGTWPTITATTPQPSFKMTEEDEIYEVVLENSLSDATMYYTLDGGEPSAATTKCYQYTVPFYVEPGVSVKAMATCNGRYDSAVATGVTPITYQISYNGNGSTSGSMSVQRIAYGSGTKFTANTFKKKGYTFTGWNTKADGSGTAYANEADASKLTKTNGKTITLYAQWKKTKYTITYDLKSGGKNNSSNPSSYYITTATITLKNPTRTGYTFAGWYSDSSYKNKITEIKKGSTGNKTIYAKWTANKYTIVYKGNGSTSGSMSSQTSRKYGTSYTLAANKFKKTGYTFVGWNTKKDGSGKSYDNKEKIKNLTAKSGGSVALYAQWEKTKYTITYKLNGGTNNSKNPTKYTDTTKTIKLKNPTKKGYTFVGWYSDSKFKNKVTQIKKGSTGKVTLYAKWTANKYQIVYDGNGSTSGKMTATTGCKYGKTYTLKSNTYKKKGYTFVGWNTKKDGSGKNYSDKEKINNLSTKSGGSVVLYAQWADIRED